jgi:integrase
LGPKLRQELTDKLIAKIDFDALLKNLDPAPRAKPSYLIVYDAGANAPPGFGIRITRAGRCGFILDYRTRGRGVKRRFTIGRADPSGVAGWKVTAARKRAGELKRQIDVGVDPAGDLARDRAAPMMNDLADRYLEDYAADRKSPRSKAEDEGLIEQYVRPAFGNRLVAEIGQGDVRKLHRTISTKGVSGTERARPIDPAQPDLFQLTAPKKRKKRTGGPAPTRANRLLQLLNKMFVLAIEWKMCSDNPVKGVERNREQPRERYLVPDDLVRLSAQLAAHPNQASADAVRLLLLTGARRGELLSASWSQFDLAAGVWTKPSAHTKQRREHRVPLSAGARQLLIDMKERAAKAARKARRDPSHKLFPGRKENETQTDLKRFWATVCTRAGIKDVRVHDLRHTYASILASAGQSLPIIGRLLGHTQPQTTARYAHLFDDPLRQATQRVDDVVTASATGKSAEVHGLPRRDRVAK